jgi:prepilin-type N-terminal cleavage/methylation domain-containing protein
VLQRLHAIRRKQDGFTLIELLIVIVILGILAGIVVFAVSGITDRGLVSACKSDVKTVEVASEAYYAKHGAYASAIKDAPLTTASLVGDGFLHDAPNSDKYTITYTAGTGAVSGSIC